MLARYRRQTLWLQRRTQNEVFIYYNKPKVEIRKKEENVSKSA